MINILILSSVLAASSGQSPEVLANIKVDGEGYLRFAREGRLVFTKEAKLISLEGKLCHIDGPKLMPEITVPQSVKTIKITLDGTVTGFNGQLKFELGRLVLGVSTIGEKLRNEGNFEFASERMTVGFASEDLLGVILDLTPKKVLGAGIDRPEFKPPIENKPPLTLPKPEPKPAVISTVSIKPTHAAIAVTEKVTFRPLFETELDEVRVRDVILTRNANMTDEYLDTIIDKTPTFGAVRKVDGFRLKTAIIAAKLDTKGNAFDSSSCTIKRASQQIIQADFTNAAIVKIKQIYGDDVVGTATNNLPAMALPKGLLTFEVTLGVLSNMKVPATVSVLVNGSKFNSRTFLVELTGLPSMPKVGAVMTVITRVSGVRVETRGRVISVDQANRSATIETDEKVRLTGKVLNETTLEVKL